MAQPEISPNASSRTADLSVHTASVPGAVLVGVTGELDLSSTRTLAGALCRVLSEPAFEPVHVDLSALTFMDSVGVSLLLDMHRLASAVGRELVVTAVSPPVARLLDITGLARLLVHTDRRTRSVTGPPRRTPA